MTKDSLHELADSKQSQAQASTRITPTRKVPLPEIWDECGGTRLLQGSSEELLTQIISLAGLLRQTLIDVGQKYPAQELGVAYSLAVGIHNRARKISVCGSERARLAADALEHLRSFGCPLCSGDCGSANPPITTCPMQQADVALHALAAATGTAKTPQAAECEASQSGLATRGNAQ